MFCPNCGAKNEDGSKFCMKCGADLSGAAPEKKSNPAGDAMRNFSSKASGAMNAAKKTASSDNNPIQMGLTVVSALFLFLSTVVGFVSFWGVGFRLLGGIDGLCTLFGVIVLVMAIAMVALYFLGMKDKCPLVGIIGLAVVVIAMVYIQVRGAGNFGVGVGFILGIIGGVVAIVNKVMNK